jgi:2-aminobenzoylacetyl-CoA thioesterase
VLEGRDGSIMINGGLSYILPDVLEQMKAFKIDARKIKKFLILHAHFDHAGIVPYFKRTYPKIEIIASGTAWKVFAMPKAIETMNSYSGLCAKEAGTEAALKAYDLNWRDDISGTTVGEGDRIDLGGMALTIMDTPGHSNCSITAYEPSLKAMFASDAAGIPFENSVFPSMNTNVIQYLESLEKLKALPVSFYCADHYGYVTGEEANTLIDLTLDEGRRWKAIMEDFYRRYGGDIDTAGKAVTDYFYREMPGYFLTSGILEGVFRQVLKFLGRNM